MTKKKVKDNEQKERTKRNVKQASRNLISTSTAQSSGTKSSTAKTDTSETQASRSRQNIRQGTRNTTTAKPTTTSNPSSMEKPPLESMISVPFGTQATRSNKLDKKLASTTMTPKIEQKTRGLAFPSNHFQTASTAKSTNGSKTRNTLIPGESLLKPISSFPSTAQSRMTTLSHTNAQDSLVSMPTQAKREATLPTTFGTQTVRSKKDTTQAASIFKTPEEWTQDVWTAVKRGDRQLAYASNLEKELEDKYGSLDYAKYIPEYKGLVTAIHQAQMEYQKQREFIEKNYRQLPLLPGQTTNHTNADRWYYEERLRQIREEMASYDEMCGGRMDLASLRSYYEQINLYESILATEPNTKGEQYMDDTFEQVLKGNYTDKATALGIALQMLAGIPNLDVAMDARDLFYDLTHLKTTRPGQVGLDAMAFAPVFGSLKYVGDVAKVAKAGDGVVDAITEIGKHADDLADIGKHADDSLALTKYLDDAAAAAKQSEGVLDTAGKLDYNKIGQAADLVDLKPEALMDELRSSGVKYTPEDVMMVTKTENGIMWLEKGNDTAGWKHITRHAEDFSNSDLAVDDLPQVLQHILQSEPTRAPIKEARGYNAIYSYKGQQYLIAYGTNGFIVSFYPYS